MSRLAQEAIREVSMDSLAASLEKSVVTSVEEVVSTEGVTDFIKNWFSKRERKKAQRKIDEGKITELSKSLNKVGSRLVSRVNKLPNNAVVELDISKWMPYFAVDGRIPANLVNGIERNAAQSSTAVEKLMGRAKQNFSVVDNIVDNINVTSDQSFQDTVLNKLNSLADGFIHSVLPGTTGSFMMGLTTSEVDPSVNFKKDVGVDKIIGLAKTVEVPRFRKVEGSLGNHRVRLNKSDLERMARCVEQYGSIATPDFLGRYAQLEEKIYIDLSNLFLIEQQESDHENHRAGLDATKSVLSHLQLIALPTYHLLEFAFQVASASVMVGVATKQVLEAALSEVGNV